MLDNGRIVEAGRNEELLARDGIYHKLHALQYRERADEGARPAAAGNR